MSEQVVDNDKTEALVGSVALVLSARRLVINRGAHHGVKVGDVFRVMSPDPEDITDPETGEVIGQVPFEKLRVKVAEVQSQLSIAETYRKVMTGGAGLDNIFGPRREELERIHSPADERPEGDSTVRIGDPVRRDRA